MKTVNYYEILGVPSNATGSDLKKAYRKLSLRWHPDKNVANREEAEIKFSEISEAYQILSNPIQRSLHDRFLQPLVGHRSDDVVTPPAAATAGHVTRVVAPVNGTRGSSSSSSSPAVGSSLAAGGAAASWAVAPSQFTVRDARAVFREFFGGRDPFSEGFGFPANDELGVRTAEPPSSPDFTSSSTQQRQSSYGNTSGRHDNVTDSWKQMPQCLSPTARATSANIKSVTTSTRFVHGKKIVTKKVMENGVETVTVEEDGILKSKTVDGVDVPLPSESGSSTSNNVSNGQSSVATWMAANGMASGDSEKS